jgi:hypothetical protein
VYGTHQNYSEPNTNVLAHKTDYPTYERIHLVYETHQNHSEPNTNVLAHRTDYLKIVPKTINSDECQNMNYLKTMSKTITSDECQNTDVH